MTSDPRLPRMPASVREHSRRYHKAWRELNPLRSWLHGAKSRATLKGLEFDISLDDLKPLPKKCPVLGLKLDYSLQKGRGMSTPEKATLDRINNKKGYVKGNVRVISAKANRIKSNMSRREASAVFQYLEGKR